jgi:phosphoglycerol transferase MdoB-like AlkP superfamily enzyme
MPHIGISLAEEQHFQENRRLGSLLLTIGWILIGINGLAVMLMFQSIREGSKFWLVSGGVVGIIGLAFIAIGTFKRRQV